MDCCEAAHLSKESVRKHAQLLQISEGKDKDQDKDAEKRPKDKKSKAGPPPVSPPQNPEEKYGLLQLYVPAKEEHIEADIVAIHGLGGDAFRTWTHENGTMWLRDILPGIFPKSRVFTFGYNSAYAFSKSVAGIEDYALDLLNRVRNCRWSPEAMSRPLIFVCHSLGGIVCKRALVISKDKPYFSNILEQSKGVMFFGTPHRGSRLASWAQLMAKYTNALVHHRPLRQDILQNLEKESSQLATIASDFKIICSPLVIYSFYELEIMLPLKCRVVEQESAVLGLNNERPIPVSADHRKIVHFSDKSSQKFEPVKSALMELLFGAPQALKPVSKEDFLEIRYLAVADYYSQMQLVPHWAEGTCTWIISHTSFKTWSESSDSEILWLRGYPAVGKSVIARYLVETTSARKISQSVHFNYVRDTSPTASHVQQTVGGRDELLLYFFCNDQDISFKSERCIMMSLLHQLLCLDPSVLKHMGFRGPWESVSSSHILGLLWTTLEEGIKACRAKTIYIVIDALDEMERTAVTGFAQSLTELHNRLGERIKPRRLQILVTSRPEPEIHEALSCASISVKSGRDMEIFVQTLVGEYASRHNFPSSVRDEIISVITEKAGDMFLWAELAWKSFHEGIRFWSPQKVKDQLQILQKAPTGLSALYTSILGKYSRSELAQLMVVFTWMVASARPLTMKEMSVAMAVKANTKRMSELDICFSQERFGQLCPNLIHVDANKHLTFVHQSFKDFLTSPDTERKYRIDIAEGHTVLAVACLRCFTFEDVDAGEMRDRVSEEGLTDEIFSQCELLRYAAQHWWKHARDAKEDIRLWRAFNSFRLRHDSFGLWWVIYRYLRRKTTYHEKYYGKTTLPYALHVAVALDLLFLVAKLIEDGEDINKPEVPALNSEVQGFFTKDALDATALFFDDITPKMISFLVNNGGDINLKDRGGDTALHSALRKDHGLHCCDLLDHGGAKANFKIKDKNGHTILHLAFAKGEMRVVEKLLSDKFFDRVEATASGILDASLTDITPLELVFLNGNEFTARRLVQNKKLLRIQRFYHTKDRHSPLFLAILHGWPDIAMVIMEYYTPSFDEELDKNKQTILHHVVNEHWHELLDYILDSNRPPRLNKMDHNGNTPLHLAAKSRNAYAAKRLLNSGCQASIPNHDGKTPLHVACEAGSERVVSSLLETGQVDLMEVDHEKRTALHYAATWDWEAVMIALLVLPGCDIKCKDKHGRLPAHMAALFGCPRVLRLLIERGTDVNSTDHLKTLYYIVQLKGVVLAV